MSTNGEISESLLRVDVEPLTPPQHDVALLIDYENLQKSLRAKYNVSAPRMSTIIEEAQEHGRLVLSRAYASWTIRTLAIDAENLYRQGIDLIYVPPSFSGTGSVTKNGADVRLAVDAVDFCGRFPGIETFVIVTGDGDLIHPINFLRLSGRRVVVIGVDRSTSQLLSTAADEVLIYERDLDPSVLSQAQTPSVGRSAPAPTIISVATGRQLVPQATSVPPPAAAFDRIQDVLRRFGNGNRMNYQDLGNVLKREYQFDSHAWYGVRLSDVLIAASGQQKVHLTEAGQISFASLPEAEEGTLETTTPDSPVETEAAVRKAESADRFLTPISVEELSVAERRAVIGTLTEMMFEQGITYLTFNRIRNRFTYRSILPRLDDSQLLRLIDSLSRGAQPILKTQSRTEFKVNGEPYSFTAFTLTTDRFLLQSLQNEDPAEIGNEHESTTD